MMIHEKTWSKKSPICTTSNFPKNSLKCVDTFGQFADDDVDTHGTPEYLCEILNKIENGANGIIMGPGEDDSWKNIMLKISCYIPFKFLQVCSSVCHTHIAFKIDKKTMWERIWK
jgi:hypothetical protein